MSSEITFDKRVTVADSIMMRELDRESVVLNLNTGHYFGLDAVGTRMWTALRASGSIQAAYESLLEEYDVEPDTLQHDLIDLVARLVDNGLMQVADA